MAPERYERRPIQSPFGDAEPEPFPSFSAGEAGLASEDASKAANGQPLVGAAVSRYRL